MRILLVNNPSGVQAYLKRGLQALGHEVVIGVRAAGTNQGRAEDVYFGVPADASLAALQRAVVPHVRLWKLGRFDVVNYCLGLTMVTSRITQYREVPALKRRGSVLSYYAVGCDEPGLMRIRDDVAEMPCASCMAHDALGKVCADAILAKREPASVVAPLFDHSISSAHIYSHCHGFFPKARPDHIPFPIDVSGLPFEPARAKPRPLMVHSPTRSGFKGTREILAAIELLRQRRDDFEFRVIEGLSYPEYIKAMRDCDIYIDQVFSGDSCGIAALENLAGGKVVVSGNGPRQWAEFPGARRSPVVPSSMRPQTLAETLSGLLDAKAGFAELAERGRHFVATEHDHVRIAERFVQAWAKRG